MNIEIIYEGRVLRRHSHDGRQFIEAPPEGEYQIRLTNTVNRRRMAVVSVDGINVVDDSKASHDGPGYVLRPWESITIKGWRRSDEKGASFTFNGKHDGLSAQTGRGTKNTGVIGVAVFDELEKPQPLIIPPIVIHHHHHESWPHSPWDRIGTPYGTPFWYSHTSDNTAQGPSGTEFLSHCAEGDGINEAQCSAASNEPIRQTLRREVSTQGVNPQRSRQRRVPAVKRTKSAPELSTGYGREVTMYTETTEFERATSSPAFLAALHYGVREKLIEWGVPVTETPQADPFPASAGPTVAPPPGWGG